MAAAGGDGEWRRHRQRVKVVVDTVKCGKRVEATMRGGGGGRRQQVDVMAAMEAAARGGDDDGW